MKKWKVFLPIFMALTLLFGMVEPLISTSQRISDKVFRLHILANSDSAADQTLKLGVRDMILEHSATLLCGETLEETIELARENQAEIAALCKTYLASKQCGYAVQVEVVREFFETRVYDDFTLPAGVYPALKITIGQGMGHNWWCILFPSVCLSACSETMQNYLSEEELALVESGYSPKFKIVEIYETLKAKF